MKPGEFRRQFRVEMWNGLKLVWPILAAGLSGMLALGIVIGLLEGWSILESIYFAFVSGLTIGYGDFAPTRPLTRILAIGLGLFGVLLVGIVVAIAVRALDSVSKRHREER
jgi:hypothetical protein